ncbi:MAG TPA: UDP-N-acetylmuramoyl-tripeptide--D-alanyl-D-alanine ligase [Solirubrobacteraceae bacterium]|jgi:UDP-N-acetylmuramoyl-tripeptide--D-alanyl-D-alanine ligase|nr:UDP-N-acetylmuramoyl-tripeptide--D-alanyl-D-alanine ligase [Solirubrobacteraceae bacterium]
MNTFLGIATVLAVLALGVRLGGRQHRLLHLLQLEHYEAARLMLWLRRRHELFAPRELVPIAVLYAAAIVLAAVDGSGSGWVSGGLLLLTTPIASLGVSDWRRPAVKPLVFTDRAQRLLVAALLPLLLLLLVAISLVGAGLTLAGLIVLLAAAFALLAFAPWTLVGANLALRPVQNAINRHYERQARHLLADWEPLTIGITGSYGKTTTKFCVGSVLSVDRPTLVTPDSYNSFLGVIRTINEHLEWRHRAFVVEMGMFRRGDIAELCELVHPKIGVITAIGPMHLERLGSIEQIAAAKGELLDALPADGHFVTNADDPRCLELAARATVPVTLFGVQDSADAGDGVLTPAGTPDSSLEALDAAASSAPRAPDGTPNPSPKNTPEAQVIARDIRLADGRTEFNLQLDGPDSPIIPVSAGLLGRHNVSNLLAAAAVGHVLGIEPARIAEGLAKVQAPPHRLQPIHNSRAGIVVIDDAYNSNPEGAAAALEVLREHPAKRRLLVTPGMVELGGLEAELNRAFGEQAGAVCDIAILVGPLRTEPIREGLAAAGMDSESIHVVRDIAEATTLLGTLTRAGDVVLFENDLPDTYTEAEAPVLANA